MNSAVKVVELEIPDLGDAEEIELVKWYVEVGDFVELGRELAEITTQKVVFTLESPTSGRVIEILSQEGSKVQKGEIVAKISVE